MRWLCLGVGMMLATGCGDEFDPLGLDDGATTGEPPPTFDYDACANPLLRDPTCVGSSCGLTPEAQDYLALMLEVVDEAGHASELTPIEAEYSPWVDELRIDYQVQVGWFRYATTVRFDVPDTEALLRQEMASHVSGWRMPGRVASPAAIEAAVERCHALLDYDPCLDNRPDFFVHERYDWTQPGCVYKTTSVVVDAQDGSTLECLVEQALPC
jgi:hypothetical protein